MIVSAEAVGCSDELLLQDRQGKMLGSSQVGKQDSDMYGNEMGKSTRSGMGVWPDIDEG